MSFLPAEFIPDYIDVHEKFRNIKEPNEKARRFSTPLKEVDFRGKELHPFKKIQSLLRELRTSTENVKHRGKFIDDIFIKKDITDKDDKIFGLLNYIIETKDELRKNKKIIEDQQEIFKARNESKLKYNKLLKKFFNKLQRVSKFKESIEELNNTKHGTRKDAVDFIDEIDVYKKINKALDLEILKFELSDVKDKLGSAKNEVKRIKQETEKTNLALKQLNEQLGKERELTEKQSKEKRRLEQNNEKKIKQLKEAEDKLTILKNQRRKEQQEIDEIKRFGGQIIKAGPRKNLTDNINKTIDTIIGNSFVSGRETAESSLANARKSIIDAKNAKLITEEEADRKLSEINNFAPNNNTIIIRGQHVPVSVVKPVIYGATAVGGGSLVGAGVVGTALFNSIPNVIKSFRNVNIPIKKDREDVAFQKITGIDPTLIKKESETIKNLTNGINNLENQKIFEQRRNIIRNVNKPVRKHKTRKTRANKNIRLVNKIKLTNIINNRRR